MIKVYFACSIRGGRDLAEDYEKLAKHISSKSDLLTEIFSDKKLTPKGMNKPNNVIWEKDTSWIKECNVMIAEVTNPSLGVGYEIAYAENKGKPILALFRENQGYSLSAMIDGSPKLKVYRYKKVEETFKIIDAFITKHT